LSRLATGRYIVTHAAIPRHDPFTFARPDAPLGHSEWLGDVIAYGCYARFGESGLQNLMIALVTLGFGLAFACALELGAPPVLALALLLITLSAAASRFAARNDVHALWLLPLFMLLLLRGSRSDRTWWLLLALGALWANLHASFVLGWALLLAALVERRVQREPLRAVPLVVVAAYPLLPWLGPVGASSYAQLWDHFVGAPVYRSLIEEWHSPVFDRAWLAILPLYVLTVLGAAGLSLARPRARVLALATFALGIVLIYSSLRFLSFMGVLLVPPAASSFAPWFGTRGRSLRSASAVLGGVAIAVYLALGMRVALRAPDAPVLERRDAPLAAASFLAAHAPDGAKFFNAFNDGPWLLWMTAPRIRHYVDPRNHLGAEFLRQYQEDVLPHPERFEREVARTGASFVLVRDRDPRMQTLARHLAQSSDWPLVYWNAEHAVHARRTEGNRALIDHFAYRVLRPTFDVGYLAEARRLKVPQSELAPELERLRSESPTAAAALEAALIVTVGGADLSRAQAQSAAQALRAAISELPATAELARAFESAVLATRRAR
jgi:hypothetical protein